ncbi:polysaccharide biosynthesis tyrosine autokinase [Parvibaculum sp.]|uniref:GumC family protein n=1 Tax=Parvibaculum sp. TaxID=2024848 RepID=UPI001B0AEFCA|nr:polysaccharide biosynthesis tyrosine autokinase [Parvibaculum sp.]MBO6634840.1 polysaccharide biosynthesis tyrosine autokinase [Parvibaculum sp.]MBO6680322.1 polysaccharide biosynthesis tyrosine autokinase [Parvibaculum sp.]MBO6686029.1 polysaccharide biosynthesis tyrosine autokinase [Parvibaculum sp.]MBO6903866.1 polysaccharide biosynthesis tyrosine autokinase [Parvibaculum sp.]
MSETQTNPIVSFGDRRRTTPDENAIGDLSPWEILRGIWARKEIILCAFAGFMAIAVFWLATVTPTYTVEARVMLSPRAGEISTFDAESGPSLPDSETLQSEIQVLTSRPLVARLIADLGLAANPEFNPALRSPGFLGRIAAAFGMRERNPQTDIEEITDVVLSRLEVYQKSGSRVIAIVFTSVDPRMAAIVPNRLAELYIAQQIEQRSGVNNEATKWLGEQIAELRVKVQKSEAAVEAFRTKSGLFLTNGSTLPQQQLTELNSQLSAAEADRAASQAKLGNARNLLASGNAVNSAAEVLQSPLIQNLRQQEVALRAQIAQMSETLLPSHPRVQEAEANLADLQMQIEKEVHKVIEALENEARVATARVNSLRASLNRLQRRMGQLNQDEVKLRALQRDADTNRALLESFLLRYQQANARAEADAQAANARIVSRAQQPADPTFPRMGSAITFATLAGVVFAFCVAFLIEVFARGFRTGDQIERGTGMPFLGLVPELDPKNRNPNPADEVMRDPSGLYAEAIRSLQGHVLLARVGQRRARVVLVTSSQPGEGKTATAASLARVFAMGGYRTVIVDADMHNPTVHEALGIRRLPGLADLLVGRAAFQHVIRRDTASHAHVIQAGTPISNTTAALASSQMQWVLTALQQTYDYIIIDSPAALATADAQVLAKLADVTVLAVKWSETDRKTVLRALKMLSAASSRRVGILLTQVNLKRYRRYGSDAIEEYPAQTQALRSRRARAV